MSVNRLGQCSQFSHHIRQVTDTTYERYSILDFVQSLSEGFATNIGLKGTRLSGGQRQVCAIDAAESS
jgi:ABC-type multidrug transport system fused ATPase/permease subunit